MDNNKYFFYNIKTKLKYFLFLLCVSIFASSCANVVSPTGGAGIKTLPFVAESSVPNGQINFTSKSIELTFNSYMNRSVVIENLNITPTTKYTHKWSGKTLKILFSDTLSSQTTYSVMLGGQFSDHYGNIADSGFYAVFSTGSIIDSGRIYGKVHNGNTEGYYIFCYKLPSDDKQDTINYLTQMADYKVLVGANGSYTVPALKDGTYRIIAVKDIDKDGTITHSRDTIGLPGYDATIKNGKPVAVNVITNNIVDTLSPILATCSTVNSNEVLLSFDETILLDSFEANCFYLTNNNNTKQFGTAYSYNKKQAKELTIYFENAINKDTTWFIAFDSNGIGSIKDGNDNEFKLVTNIEVNNQVDSIYFPKEEEEIFADSAVISNLGLSGLAKDSNVINDTGNENLLNNRYLLITEIQNGKQYLTKINSDNTFKFENIDAGEYRIFYFCDLNSNQKHDAGKLIPFEFAEPFTVIDKTITLKPKWSIDNYELEIKKTISQ